MKRIGFEYEVKVNIEVSDVEIDALISMAGDHYDHTVKAMAKPRSPNQTGSTAGLLYGWNNQLGDDPSVQVSVNSRQLGLLNKVLEPLSMAGGDMFATRYPAAVPLWMPFKQLLTELNEEYERIHHEGGA